MSGVVKPRHEDSKPGLVALRQEGVKEDPLPADSQPRGEQDEVEQLEPVPDRKGEPEGGAEPTTEVAEKHVGIFLNNHKPKSFRGPFR